MNKLEKKKVTNNGIIGREKNEEVRIKMKKKVVLKKIAKKDVWC